MDTPTQLKQSFDQQELERLDLALAGAPATVDELGVQHLADMWTKLAIELKSLQPLISAINENFPAAKLPKSPKRKRSFSLSAL